MKKCCLYLIMFAFTGIASAQTLITYGNNTISKAEFLRAYNKNKPVVTDKEKSLREYAELYSNFKLKVKAAKELGIDTLPQIKYDVENFRNQVMENYLTDDAAMKKLEDEAFKRSQKDIHVIHYFVAVANNASVADTVKAYKEIQETYQLLKNKNSNGSIPAKQSDIGFITAFTLPYKYENIIYNTKPGEVSMPYRSNNGWHIFKIAGVRPSAGKWKVAQILFAFPLDADAATKARIKRLADSVCTLVQNGMNFGIAAKTYSNDKLTYLTEGEMPAFSPGTYSSAFENEIIKLSKNGEISQPFETGFGYHIVKRLGVVAIPADTSDEAYQLDLKQRVLQDDRVNTVKESFAKYIVNKTGFKKSAAVSLNDLYRFADSLMKDPTEANTAKLPISKKTIATFSNGVVKGSDWLKYVRDSRADYLKDKGVTNQQLWKKFESAISVEYYKKNLEKYNAAFKAQMEEFREGNMLFEIMERKVWNKAAADSAGLKEYYNNNKSKYKWAASADILLFNCTSLKIAQEAMAALKGGKYWKTITETSNASIQADSGRYELSQITGSAKMSNLQANEYSAITNNIDGTASFVKYLHIYPANEQRSFEEAKGLVINDYQNLLEQEWLTQLKLKYPVKINEAVFKQLLK